MKLSRRIVALAAVLSGIAVIGMTATRLNAPTPAPPVGYTLLDGRQGTLQSLRGKVVLVNFWATSCAVCVKEMPRLVETHHRFQARGFETLAVAMRHDPPAYVVDFATRRRLPFPVAIDNTGAIADAFGDVAATPTTYLIDRRGEIVRRYVGEPDFAELHALLERLLSEG